MNSLTPLLAFISLATPILAAGNPATFWSDYPACEETCHQSVWAASSCTLSNTCACSGCLCLADSCLCETPSWLTAVAQCIGEQCGSAGVVNAASIAASACAGNGHPLAVPSASLVSIGLAAIPATTEAAGASTAGVSIASSVAGATGVQSSVQTVASTAMTITSTSSSTSLTTPSSFTAGGASTPSSLSPISSSSGLSTGAKAGIAIGAVLIALLIISLVAFIFCQRRRSRSTHPAIQPAAENPFSNQVPELAGVDARPPIYAQPQEKKGLPSQGQGGNVAELHGGVSGKEAVSPVSAAAFPEKGGMGKGMQELAAPLSEEERQELESRRRAAELSGKRGVVVREGMGERSELEERRGIWELA